MTFQNSVYITSLGKFLPGKPVANDEMEDYLGFIGGKPSRLKSRILKQNGIKSRHYAIEPGGKIQSWNYELAANALKDALSRSELDSQNVEFMATATSQSDLLAPDLPARFTARAICRRAKSPVFRASARAA
jgi:3-oxoacyl-[acyl-carrier-protein] synthase-3